jgi:probable O-glycosylation ligase (exosortase A-associated)
MSIRALLLYSALFPCLPVCFVRPFFGILLWNIFAYVSPQWYAWGAGRELPLAEMVAIPTILGFIVFHRGWSRLVTREMGLLFILWGWFVITTINSVSTPLFEPHANETWYRLEFVSKILLMTVLTVCIVDSFARLRVLVMVIGCSFGFHIVKAIPFIIATGGNFRVYGPPRSMIEDNNDLGLALNMTLPMLFFLAQSEQHPKLRRLFWFLTFACVPTILCTYSRGALVGMVAVFFLMFMRLKQRMTILPVVVLGIAAIVLFAPDQWKDRMNFSRKDRVVDGSAYSRINAWTFSWNLANDYPITGGGFDTFTQELFNRYAPNYHDLHGPHSIYFGVLAEHGFVGLALYLSLVVSCIATLRRLAKWSRYQGDEVANHYAHMFMFSLTGFLASGAFLGRAYFDYYFTIVALIVILKQVCFSTWRSHNTIAWQLEEAA